MDNQNIAPAIHECKEHTPGPWLRIDGPDYAEIHAAFRPSSPAVALVGKADDARLIAAAPKLLEALKDAHRIIMEIDNYMKRPERGDWGTECALCMGELLDDDREAIEAMRAAITKAEG